VAQLVVVDDILVPKRDAKDPLAQHRRQLVDDERRAATVAEARGKPGHEVDRSVGLPKQECACVRADLAAIERTHNMAPLDGSEIQRILATLCRHRGASRFTLKSLLHNNFR
jgi:hypothetical protein